MVYKPSPDSKFLPIQFNKFRCLHRSTSWWAPVWRGLVVEQSGKHYRAMHTAVWLYLYLLIHADRKTGKLYRLIGTIANDMGVKPPTVRRWLATLARHGYITRNRTGRALDITIERWKALPPLRRY